MKSLKVLAEANHNRLKKTVEEWPETAWVKGFVSLVSASHFLSTNVKLERINHILESGYVKDMYQLIWEEQERLAAQAEDIPHATDLAKAWMKGYHEKREAFTSFFNDAKSYIYTAMNLGNLGALLYGPLCIR